MKVLFNVKEKVIVITGGGGVLCGAMAQSLGGAGAKVAVLDLAEEADIERGKVERVERLHGESRRGRTTIAFRTAGNIA